MSEHGAILRSLRLICIAEVAALRHVEFLFLGSCLPTGHTTYYGQLQ